MKIIYFTSLIETKLTNLLETNTLIKRQTLPVKCTLGQQICSEEDSKSGFYTCTNTGAVFRECGPGTYCNTEGTGFPYCDYDKSRLGKECTIEGERRCGVDSISVDICKLGKWTSIQCNSGFKCIDNQCSQKDQYSICLDGESKCYNGNKQAVCQNNHFQFKVCSEGCTEGINPKCKGEMEQKCKTQCNKKEALNCRGGNVFRKDCPTSGCQIENGKADCQSKQPNCKEGKQTCTLLGEISQCQSNEKVIIPCKSNKCDGSNGQASCLDEKLDVCSENEVTCDGNGIISKCTGGKLSIEKCKSGKCISSNGSIMCVNQGRSSIQCQEGQQRCNPNGTISKCENLMWTKEICESGRCFVSNGEAKCSSPENKQCINGEKVCNSDGSINICSDGSWKRLPCDGKCKSRHGVIGCSNDDKCIEGEKICLADGSLKECKNSNWVKTNCPNSKCGSLFGQVQCINKNNESNNEECEDGDQICTLEGNIKKCEGGKWVESQCQSKKCGGSLNILTCLDDSVKCKEGYQLCDLDGTISTCKNGQYVDVKCSSEKCTSKEGKAECVNKIEKECNIEGESKCDPLKLEKYSECNYGKIKLNSCPLNMICSQISNDKTKCIFPDDSLKCGQGVNSKCSKDNNEAQTCDNKGALIVTKCNGIQKCSMISGEAQCIFDYGGYI